MTTNMVAASAPPKKFLRNGSKAVYRIGMKAIIFSTSYAKARANIFHNISYAIIDSGRPTLASRPRSAPASRRPEPRGS
jgi:hypothetical protein